MAGVRGVSAVQIVKIATLEKRVISNPLGNVRALLISDGIHPQELQQNKVALDDQLRFCQTDIFRESA
tara:strand:+ start:44017 stop:44220 length:204 start_codon:yes stop_codon:yes gene_type:complete